MVNIDAIELATQAGGGVVIGVTLGVIFKKVMKVVAAVIGLQFGLLAYLEHRGVIEVDWGQLSTMSSITPAGTDATLPPVMLNLLSLLPVSGGLAAGLLIGFKTG